MQAGGSCTQHEILFGGDWKGMWWWPISVRGNSHWPTAHVSITQPRYITRGVTATYRSRAVTILWSADPDSQQRYSQVILK